METCPKCNATRRKGTPCKCPYTDDGPTNDQTPKEAMSSADIKDRGVKDTHLQHLLKYKPKPEKIAEEPRPIEVALPDHDYWRQHLPKDEHHPEVKPSKKKT